MIVLIDTNVMLDILLQREPYSIDAARLSVLSEKGCIHSYLSASAVTDIFYIARKELKDKEVAHELIQKIVKTVHIAAVTENSIVEALELKWNDFEDAVQYSVGKSISANYIITRNPDDYANSEISIVSPRMLLDQIESAEQ